MVHFARRNSIDSIRSRLPDGLAIHLDSKPMPKPERRTRSKI
jgi:hypothetical protein